MSTLRKILLTGGGTAGHVNPALAIGAALGAEASRFLFVGVRGRVEERIVPRDGIPIRFVRASGYPGPHPTLALARFFLDLVIGIVQSVFILLSFRPEIIVGSGGYASAPVILAASLLLKVRLCKTRIFIHEQNAAPGRFNQLIGRFAHKVFVTFPETLPCFPRNGVLVGYPLRNRISRVAPEEARRHLDFNIPVGRKVIFAFSGSQGARTINRAIIESLQYLLPHRDQIFIVHGMGLFQTPAYNAVEDCKARLHASYDENQLRKIAEFYVARDYFHDIQFFYAVSDLVIVRGGAGSLNEVSALGLPAIVIPKSNLPGDHQVMNARSMERAGGAEILYEEMGLAGGQLVETVDGRALAEKIISLVQDEPLLAEMGECNRKFLPHGAAAEIARMIAGFEEEEATTPQRGEVGEGEFTPTNYALLAALDQACSRLGAAYSVESVVSNSRDLKYFRNRAAALLIHPNWQERNVGVKLLGLLGARDALPLLLALFNDRRPVSLLKRIFGGDFVQTGFVRRNIITAIGRLGKFNPEVREALLLAFMDPYYEVQSEAAHVAGQFGRLLVGDGELLSKLKHLLTDRNIEVAAAAAEALGLLSNKEDALPALLEMRSNKMWKIRAAALKGILHLVRRGQISDLSMLEEELPTFALTSTDFGPQFEIKSIFRQLMDALSSQRAEMQSGKAAEIEKFQKKADHD